MQEGTIKKWWFVVCGDEPTLELLEEEWPKVAVQTLEHFIRYDYSDILAQQPNEVRCCLQSSQMPLLLISVSSLPTTGHKKPP